MGLSVQYEIAVSRELLGLTLSQPPNLSYVLSNYFSFFFRPQGERGYYAIMIPSNATGNFPRVGQRSCLRRSGAYPDVRVTFRVLRDMPTSARISYCKQDRNLIVTQTAGRTVFFFLFFHTHSLSSFWTSRGHRCRPFPPPPVLALNVLSRILVGFGNPTARRFLIECC